MIVSALVIGIIGVVIGYVVASNKWFIKVCELEDKLLMYQAAKGDSDGTDM